MLNVMRKYATNWMIKIILGAIVIVFVFWGVGSFSSKKEGRVALVNGEPITVEEYRQTYENLVEQLKSRFGSSMNDEMIKMFQVKRQALEKLIDQKLLLKEARDLDLQVSDSEIAGAIRKIRAFQTAGVFDRHLYKNILNRNNLAPEEFEMIQRQSMLMEKIRSLVTSCVKVSDNEAMQWFKWDDAEVNIDYVLFKPELYKDIKPSAEELRLFFGKHKTSYKTEPQIKTAYLYFDSETYTEKVNISDEEIKDYYEASPEEFKNQKTVEARHILIKIRRDANPETVEKARTKALEIMKMAVEGKDFAELAKQYSEGPSKNAGGQLGAFKKEEMVKPFSDKAFSMNAGDISEPVRTDFGWHIIKVEKVNEEFTLSLDDAKPEIRKILTVEKAKNLAYNGAEAAYNASFEGDDLIKIGQSLNLKVMTTGFFTKKDGPDKSIKDHEKFTAAAFNLSLMEISDVLDFENGYYIFQVTERLAERIPELKNVEKRVREDLIKEKQDEKAGKDAERFFSAIKAGKSISEESGKFDLTPVATGFFKRNDPIPDIGFEQKIISVAFKLSSENKLPENVIRGDRGYYVIEFKDRKKPELEKFEKKKTDIKKRLLQQKKADVYDAWLLQLRNRNTIIVEEGVLDS